MPMKIVLLGDSITQGLGSKKINFVKELQKLTGEETKIINLALTGTTILYAIDILDKIKEEKADLVLILYGNVDAQIRPNREGFIFKKLPTRFKINNGSMISPRPFYSQQWYKKILQKGENLLRTIIRKLIYAVDGIEQWVDISEFEMNYCLLCDKLNDLRIKYFLCSTVYIDNKLFPGSLEEYAKYNNVIKKLSIRNQVPFIDIYSMFSTAVLEKGWSKYYNYDHFHPNESGYILMAEKIAKEIGKWENED